MSKILSTEFIEPALSVKFALRPSLLALTKSFNGSHILCTSYFDTTLYFDGIVLNSKFYIRQRLTLNFHYFNYHN